MQLSPRQVAFVKSEMKRVMNDDARQPTEKVEAERIKEQADSAITE